VEQFSPYNELKQPYPEVRAAAVALAKTAGEAQRKKKAFVYVNNRLEGSALRTLEAITAEIAPGA
jgi:hypothetical protein